MLCFVISKHNCTAAKSNSSELWTSVSSYISLIMTNKYASEWSRMYYFYLMAVFKYIIISFKFCFQISYLCLNLFYTLHIFHSFLEFLFSFFLQLIIYCCNPGLFIKMYIELAFSISNVKIEHEKSKPERTFILLSKHHEQTKS